MSKCNYCAFFSRACRTPDWDAYCKKIISEITHWGRMLGQITVPTIFFGGGTPSLMPTAAFGRIIDALGKNFHIDAECEITLESNPGTLDGARLAEFAAAGMNRLSVGVQSLDDARLRFLGRRHDASDALRLLDCGMRRGIRTSADFIYGMPGDSADTVAALCRRINDLGLKHCSMYELTIEPDTPFGKMNLQMPDNNEMAEMYQAIEQTLRLPRYEVSNYAAPGHECRHNQNVWAGAPYIGIGPHAAGRVLIDGDWYEQIGDGALMSPLSRRDRAIERVLTGMRTMRGVNLSDDIRDIIDMNFIRTHPDLIRTDDKNIRATPKGILILDDLLINLVK